MVETSSTNATVSATSVREVAVFSVSVPTGSTKIDLTGLIPTGYARSVTAAVKSVGAGAVTVYHRALFANRNIVIDDAGVACNATSVSLPYTGVIGEEHQLVVSNASGIALVVTVHLIARS